MLKIDSMNYSNKQYSIKNNNNYFVQLNDNQTDSISFKALNITKSPKNSLIKKISKFLGIVGAGTTATVVTQNVQKTQINNESELIWNSECKGYKRLLEYGFSSDLIDKTLDKLEPEKAEILKTGINTWIIRGGAGELYKLINKELNDDEKSTEMAFNILADVFSKATDSHVSKNEYLLIRPLEAALRIYGLDAFNRGTLVNYGYWNSDFRLEDENGKDITDRKTEIIDYYGNKLVVSIDSYNKPIMDKGKKYSPDDKLIEEWSSGSRTIYEYDENNQLIGKQDEYGNGFHKHTTKYKYNHGAWVEIEST